MIKINELKKNNYSQKTYNDNLKKTSDNKNIFSQFTEKPMTVKDSLKL